MDNGQCLVLQTFMIAEQHPATLFGKLDAMGWNTLGRICHGALDGTPALHRPLAVPPASLCSGAGKAATKVVATEASHLGSSKCQFKRLGVEIWGWNFGEASNHPKPREGLKHLHMKQFHLQHSFLQNVKWLHGLNRPTPKATKIIQDLPCQNHFKTASSGAVVPCSLGLFGPTGSESMEKRTAVQGADVSFVLIKTLLSL